MAGFNCSSGIPFWAVRKSVIVQIASHPVTFHKKVLNEIILFSRILSQWRYISTYQHISISKPAPNGWIDDCSYHHTFAISLNSTLREEDILGQYWHLVGVAPEEDKVEHLHAYQKVWATPVKISFVFLSLAAWDSMWTDHITAKDPNICPQ